MTVLERILETRRNRGAGYFVLLDPDKWPDQKIVDVAAGAAEAGADAILIGGSLLLSASFDELVYTIKRNIDVPLIIFPGSQTQISRHADALFFLSLISGRNPNYLIGEQVKAAPAIKALGIEAIAVGYMLIESGSITSAEFMSDTRPIPRDKPDIAKATALAAEFLGHKLVYLEAGSGARYAVPDDMIEQICGYTTLPLIVGGGIRTPAEARSKVEAGAAFVVTGNVLENGFDTAMVREFADAVHRRA